MMGEKTLADMLYDSGVCSAEQRDQLQYVTAQAKGAPMALVALRLGLAGAHQIAEALVALKTACPHGYVREQVQQALLATDAARTSVQQLQTQMVDRSERRASELVGLQPKHSKLSKFARLAKLATGKRR